MRRMCLTGMMLIAMSYGQAEDIPSMETLPQTLTTIGCEAVYGEALPTDKTFWVVMQASQSDTLTFHANIPENGVRYIRMIITSPTGQKRTHQMDVTAGGGVQTFTSRQRLLDEGLYTLDASLLANRRGEELASISGIFRAAGFHANRKYTDADFLAAFTPEAIAEAEEKPLPAQETNTADEYDEDILRESVEANTFTDADDSISLASEETLPASRVDEITANILRQWREKQVLTRARTMGPSMTLRSGEAKAKEFLEIARQLYGRAEYALPLPAGQAVNWSGDAVAARLSDALDIITGEAIQSHLFDEPETRRLFFGKLLEDMRLLTFLQRNLPDENLDIQRHGVVICQLAEIMPFCVDADTWFTIACHRMLKTGGQHFWNDGAPEDGDIFGKGALVLMAWMMAEESAAAFPRRAELIEDYREAYRKPLTHFFAHLSPGQTIPRVGQPAGTPIKPAMVIRLAKAAARAAGANTMMGADSMRPWKSWPETSDTPSWGGHYVTRGGLLNDLRFANLILRPYLSGQVPHDDFGSLVLTAYGVPFIVDPGWAYGDSAAYASSAFAHSSIFLDGVPMGESDTVQKVEPAPLPWTWVTNSVMDCAQADAGDMMREMFYIKSQDLHTGTDYWLLRDTFRPESGTTHDAVWKLQFAPGLRAVCRDNAVLVSADERANLQVIPADAARTAMVVSGPTTLDALPLSERTRAALSPHAGGMVTSDAGQLIPAPAAFYAAKLEGPTSFNTVLLPLPTEYRTRALVREHQSLNKTGGSLITVALGEDRLDCLVCGNGTDLDVFSRPSVQLRGQRALVRIFEGRIQAVSLLQVTQLLFEEEGGIVWGVSFDEPATGTMIRTASGKVELTLDTCMTNPITVTSLRVGLTHVDRRMRIRPGQTRTF